MKSHVNSYGVRFNEYPMPDGSIVIQRAGKPIPTMSDVKKWESDRQNARSGMKLPRQLQSIKLNEPGDINISTQSSGGCGS